MTHDLRRPAKRAAKRPAGAAMERLDAAADQMVKAQTGRDARPRKYSQNVPIPAKDLLNQLSNNEITPKEFLDELNVNKMGQVIPGFTVRSDGSPDIAKGKRIYDHVDINPYAAEEILAHELGHSVFGETRVGDALQRMRLDPKLASAVSLAGGLTAMTAAGLTPGDDDLDEAIIGTMALNAPTLIDEAAATRNAFAMMKQSGRPATLGQKGRLAGAYLTYLGGLTGGAVLANTLGNQFDEDV